jgi:hypothetical protein
MFLKCILKRTDFIPMVKSPRFWQSSKTLSDGDEIEIDDATGHQVLAAYPGAFQVVGYGEREKKTEVKRGRPKLEVENKSIEVSSLDTKRESEVAALL